MSDPYLDFNDKNDYSDIQVNVFHVNDTLRGVLPDKRNNILGEEGLDKTNPGAQRNSHAWYTLANKMCEENCYKIFDPSYKPHTWDDVFRVANQ